jgi:small-conductance mechanosensitive channel
MFDELQRSFDRSPHLWQIAGVVLIPVIAVAVARIAQRIVSWVYWRRIDEIAPDRLDQLQRTKRQQTIVSLLESVIRYVVYGTAGIALIWLISGGLPSAIFGASLVVVVAGFGMQRLLGDAVAGMFLLVEGQYAVGDYLEIASPSASGIVEAFSVRTTTLRSVTGERTVVMNGSITGFTKVPRGFRSLGIRCVTTSSDEETMRAADAALARVQAIAGEQFLSLPEHAEISQLGPGRTLAKIEVVVPPSLEQLVSGLLVPELKRSLGDALEGDPAVTAVASDAFDRYARNVIVPQ